MLKYHLSRLLHLIQTFYLLFNLFCNAFKVLAQSVSVVTEHFILLVIDETYQTLLDLSYVYEIYLEDICAAY